MGGQHSSCTHPKSKCYHAGSPKAQVVRVAPPDLTSKQKQLLKTAWERLERDIADVGIITFLGMFETHPNVQDIFMPFVGLARTDEQYSKTLRDHALRVMATVEKCIHRLDEPERMRTVLEVLGARHVSYNAKIEYVDVLGSQFVKAVKENSANWNDDLENAWLSLVRIITFYVKHGWMDKEKQQVTREVTRKEYLSSKASAKTLPTNPPPPTAKPPPPTTTTKSSPTKPQANGGPADSFSNALIPSGKPSSGLEPRPATENGKIPDHPPTTTTTTTTTTKPSQVSVNGREEERKAGHDPKPCNQV